MTGLVSQGPLRFLIVAGTTGTIGWAVSAALSPSIPALLLVVMVMLAVVEAELTSEVGWRRDITRSQLRSMRLAELVLAFVAVKAGQLTVAMTEGANPSAVLRSPFDRETIVVWLITIAAWIFAAGTISDLERLGSPPERAPNYRPPMPSLTARFLGGGVVIVAAGALALVDLPVLPDPRRAVAGAWFWPAALYFVTVLLVLGAIRQHEAQLQWKRQNIEVEPEVRARWWAGVGVVVAVATLSMIVVPVLRAGNALSYVYDRILVSVAWAAGSLGIDLRLTEADSSPARPGTMEEATTGIEPIAGSTSLASDTIDVVFGFLFLLGMVGLAFAAVRLLRGLDLPDGTLSGGALAGGILRAVWTAISALPRLLLRGAQALLAWLRRLLEREEPALGVVGRAPPARVPPPVWGSDDPHRMQIAQIYARFLSRAGQWLGGRKRWETPTEYGLVVSTLIGRSQPVEVLTQEFNEARYSTHPIRNADVARARSALEIFEQHMAEDPPGPKKADDSAS